MSEEKQTIENDPVLDKRIMELKAEIFDLIKQSDIVNITKNNRLKELAFLESKKNPTKSSEEYVN